MSFISEVEIVIKKNIEGLISDKTALEAIHKLIIVYDEQEQKELETMANEFYADKRILDTSI